MHGHDQAWSHVLITGASSGIGRALAIALAGPGRRLALQGRDGIKLEAVAAASRAAGAEVATALLDVRDEPALRHWIAETAAIRPLDLVVANAGISGRHLATDIMAVNLLAVIATTEAAHAAMRPERQGQIALVSSLAGFRGMPSAPLYCASKAAVRVYGEGMRPRLARDGIGLSVVCPGFVATPMTANNPFPMPLLMTAERSAEVILKGLARNRARIAFPMRMHLLALLVALLPAALVDRLTAGMAAKE